MFNTAPIMEWHNTTLLCCFGDFWHIDEKCKSFDCKDLKTGGGIQRFYGQSVDFCVCLLRSNETLHQVGFQTQIHGFLDKFGFLVKIFNNKKVINIMWITQNNMWITFCLKTYLKTKFPHQTHKIMPKSIHIPHFQPKITYK